MRIKGIHGNERHGEEREEQSVNAYTEQEGRKGTAQWINVITFKFIHHAFHG